MLRNRPIRESQSLLLVAWFSFCKSHRDVTKKSKAACWPRFQLWHNSDHSVVLMNNRECQFSRINRRQQQSTECFNFFLYSSCTTVLVREDLYSSVLSSLCLLSVWVSLLADACSIFSFMLQHVSLIHSAVHQEMVPVFQW